jgi:glycerate dehydrogenase
MRIVLLDSFTADQGEAPTSAWPELAAAGELIAHARTPAARLLERCQDADAIVTNKVVLDAQALAALPRLRYVGVCATGTNVVDVGAARARGIAVTNVPGYAAEAVAQLAFALILHLTVDVAGHSAAVKAGRWAAGDDFCFFLRPLPELRGKTLVIVGRGAIGGAVARIAEGFGMRVVAAAVPGSPAAGRVPLAEALPAADVVTLHCPLTPATTNLVNAGFLAQLKPGALLVNTSRGGLVDEAALIEALASGRLGGAGLDVLSREPPPADHPLTDPRAPWAARVVVTPHIAWGTIEARARLRREVGENLRAWAAGERRNRVD